MLTASLNRVLTAIAKQLSLSPEKLIQYAHEAPYAKVTPEGRAWPSGTGSISEKRILYAIARGLNPMLSLDIGTRWGASAVQIATGDNGAEDPPGRTISVDVETHMYGSKQPVGRFIPDALKVELVTSDATLYLKMDGNFYELIYEDTDHTFESTQEIYNLALDRLVAGGVIISHDACHPKFKGAVVNGIRACGIEPQVYLVEGDSCGLSIWQKPKDGETEALYTRRGLDGVIKSGPIDMTKMMTVEEYEAQLKPAPPGTFPDLPEELPEPETREEIIEPAKPKRKKRKATKRKKKSVAIEEV